MEEQKVCAVCGGKVAFEEKELWKGKRFYYCKTHARLGLAFGWLEPEEIQKCTT